MTSPTNPVSKNPNKQDNIAVQPGPAAVIDAAPNAANIANAMASRPRQSNPNLPPAGLFLSEDSLLEQETEQTLNEIMSTNPDMSTADLKNVLVQNTQVAIQTANSGRPKEARIRTTNTLRPMQIAMCILRREPILCIQCGGKNNSAEYDVLGLYMKDGPRAGTYTIDERVLRNLVREYNANISPQDLADVMQRIKDNAPHKPRCEDKDLIAVNNGIFDYRTKKLMPFDPKHVFLTKTPVDYVDNPVNPMIQNPDGTMWDVESWLADVMGDKELTELIWQLIGAIVRPFVPWGKSAWFYSSQGNNGKGTICELMRQIAGDGNHASITLASFSQDFQLEPLINANSIIVDENDVGGYIDRSANIKAVITNDVLMINRKHKTPISFRFRGIMIQCINDFPKIKDTSDSFYRRQLFVPFEKCFTGRENKLIKSEYLRRRDVLEYVLHKVLHMDYYQFIEPAACKIALAEYKEYNNPVEQFMAEMTDTFQWDLLPFGFLYDLYKNWYAKVMPSGKPQGRNTFIKDLQSIVVAGHFPEWTYLNQAVHPNGRMDLPEPLIITYGLRDWANQAFDATNPTKYCTTPLKASYKGLIRFGAMGANDLGADSDPGSETDTE